MTDHSALNRREFLKLLTAGAALIWGNQSLPVLASEDKGDGANTGLPEFIPVPPSLMLHSRHRWKLAAILGYLSEVGYEGITYRDLNLAISGELELPEKPILISIDDLSPFQGNPSHGYFTAMKDLLVEYGFKGTFSVVTRPDETPDEARWNEVAGWVADGIALETHSAYHSNLDNPNLTADDYRVEIVESARFIAERSGVPVCALVTPFGSGYDPETQTVNPQVVIACQEAGIRFAVGIIGGRYPISTDISPREVLYVGRVGPGLTDDVAGARYEIEHWQS